MYQWVSLRSNYVNIPAEHLARGGVYLTLLLTIPFYLQNGWVRKIGLSYSPHRWENWNKDDLWFMAELGFGSEHLDCQSNATPLCNHTVKQLHCHFFLVVKIKVEKHQWKIKWIIKVKAKNYSHKMIFSLLCPACNLQISSPSYFYSLLVFIMCHKEADRRWSYFPTNDLISPHNCSVNKKKSALGFVTYVTGTLF